MTIKEEYNEYVRIRCGSPVDFETFKIYRNNSNEYYETLKTKDKSVIKDDF